MNKPGHILIRYKNIFLLSLLLATLLLSGYANHERLEAASTTVDIPVTEVFSEPAGALESFREQRDQEALADIAALEKLCAQENLDKSTREAAAAQLQTLLDNRQSQTALEGALAGSSLYPCVAVVQGGSVTIVTEKETITEQDSAMVLTLAAAHTGVSPENVRIITPQ